MKAMYFLSTLLISTALHAAPIKVGVLAPEGTGWAKNIKKMTSEIKEVTKGEVDFKVYYGGTQGDEQDVLRKIRIGQLQGGIFSGKTLGEINGDVRIVEVPFTFNHNREKALKTLKVLAPFFNQKYEKNGFKNLATFEIGQVYFVTQKKVDNLEAIKSLKIWSWDGDPIVTNLFQTMNLTGVPLGLPDVLSSLSTGVVEAAYSPALGIIALQWNTKVKYIVDFPISYSVGAFVISTKAWTKISPENQKKVEEVARKYEEVLNLGNAKDNEDALAVMRAQKIESVRFSDADIKIAQSYREKMIKSLTGKVFSAEAVKKIDEELAKK